MVVESKPFIDPRLELQWISEIQGWGVFTTEDLPPNFIIERSPLIIFPEKIVDMTYWMLQAEGIRSESFMLDRYMIRWGDSSAIPLGWCGLYNHSDTNNVTFQAHYEAQLMEIRTLRPITRGAQCLVSYGSEWFQAKGYITKVDF